MLIGLLFKLVVVGAHVAMKSPLWDCQCWEHHTHGPTPQPMLSQFVLPPVNAPRYVRGPLKKKKKKKKAPRDDKYYYEDP